jgi:hypothetical protein
VQFVLRRFLAARNASASTPWRGLTRAELAALYGASGALGLVCAQHHAATTWFAARANAELQARHLPALRAGERLWGLATTHLSSSGPPAVVAERTARGFAVSGCARWVSGHGFFDDLLLAARAPGECSFHAVIALRAAGVRVGPMLALGAMRATNTASVSLDALPVAPADVFLFRDERASAPPPSSVAAPALEPVGHPFLGAAATALDVAEQAARDRDLLRVADLIAPLHDELRRIWERDGQRAEADEMIQRCVRLAVLLAGGAAAALAHAANRLHRESLLYEVLALGHRDLAAKVSALLAA